MFETPVIFGDLWSRIVGPLWEAALFDIFDTFLSFDTSGEDNRWLDADRTNRVCEYCFFLKVSHELTNSG